MDVVSQSSRSITSKMRQAVKGKEGPQPVRAPITRSLSALGHEPQLSAYIVTRALKRPEVGLTCTMSLGTP